MKNSLLIEDGEKKDILSQHDEIDQKIYNFLIRRIKVVKKDLNRNWADMEPLKVIEYSFEGLPGYGFTDYVPKKRMESKIIEMLYEQDIIGFLYDMNENDPERKKIIKTIRKFLNFVLVDQK
jgi:hypothetical protein